MWPQEPCTELSITAVVGGEPQALRGRAEPAPDSSFESSHSAFNQTATAAQPSPHSSENSKDTIFFWLNLNTTTLKKYKFMCPLFEPTAPGKPRGLVNNSVHCAPSLIDDITAVETIKPSISCNGIRH